MASAKRKQDEKHLKTLRELVSQGGNKECFDCRQRGPTYVNMTIGSFVCTSCSGMLRGLTPPHRVKSISMATFSPEEIEFIKEHGNEQCRGIWLGLMNANTPLTIDTKDEQKMKDLMSAKYEHKRYYLDPTMANGNSNQKSQIIHSQSNKSSFPQKQIDTIPILCSPNQKKKSTSNIPTFTTDFVADFSQVPDPFVSTTSTPIKFPVQSQASFADFENNPAFDSTNSMSFNQIKPSMTNFNEIPAPPSEDKYAALKDLDCLMKKAHLSKHTGALTRTNDQNGQNGHVSNPFTENGVWNSSLHAINNNNLQPMDNTICNNTANPFRSSQFPIQNESQWIPFESPSCTDVLPSSQLVTPSLSGKVWHPTVSAYQANPFMVGNPMRSSNNPFL